VWFCFILLLGIARQALAIAKIPFLIATQQGGVCALAESFLAASLLRFCLYFLQALLANLALFRGSRYVAAISDRAFLTV
jgi:hypothetical protein